MSSDINELIYASEHELWAVANATVEVLTRRAAPHAWESEAYTAASGVIMARRAQLLDVCQKLRPTTDPTRTVSSVWLAQLRNEFLAAVGQRDVLNDMVLQKWQPMDTAPVDRRIMLKRPRWFGGPTASDVVGIGRWETQPHHKTPRPYWNDDRSIYGVAENRKSEPTGWMEIPR